MKTLTSLSKVTGNYPDMKSKVIVKDSVAHAIHADFIIKKKDASKDGSYLDNIYISGLNNNGAGILKDFELKIGELLETYEFYTGNFLNWLEWLAPSMSKEETRYYLNGICLKGGDIVATDAHTLKRVDLKAAEYPSIEFKNPEYRQGSIINRNTVTALIRLLKANKSEPNIKLKLYTKGIIVSIGDYQLTSKFIDGTYPEYERIIPNVNNSNYLEYDFKVKPFKQALKSVKVLCKAHQSADKKSISIHGDEIVWLADGKTVVGKLDIPFPIKYSFNCECLSKFKDGKLFLNTNQQDSALLDCDNGYSAVIMPVRI